MSTALESALPGGYAKPLRIANLPSFKISAAPCHGLNVLQSSKTVTAFKRLAERFIEIVGRPLLGTRCNVLRKSKLTAVGCSGSVAIKIARG